LKNILQKACLYQSFCVPLICGAGVSITFIKNPFDMATSNFHNVNASVIFACELENDFDYEDLFDNVRYSMKELDEWDGNTKSDPNELHSYSSRSIGALSKYVSDDESGIDVIVTAVTRSGYYEGCNLDWHCEYNEWGENVEHLLPLAEKAKWELVDKIESIFEQFSTPLGVVARFSNGETIYEKI
jgi:hypothetical protein